jgi:hypothetical protein
MIFVAAMTRWQGITSARNAVSSTDRHQDGYPPPQRFRWVHPSRRCLLARVFVALLFALLPLGLRSAAAEGAPDVFGHLAELRLPGGTQLHYFTSTPANPAAIRRILIVVQGYTRDANRTFDAGYRATEGAGLVESILIVAPIFQVAEPEAQKCHFRDMPAATAQDALWHCGTWSAGAPALNDPTVTSFGALDALLATLLDSHPRASSVTIAGFSAGGQFVQRYVAFATVLRQSVETRYVVADPSSYLYFDSWRPKPGAAACPGYDKWKYGTADLPSWLGRDAMAARATYAAANLTYLEGALDTGMGPGTASALLESDCAAELQGEYRLDRGENYAAYDVAKLAHGAHKLIVVPGCAHSVTCVFPSPAARTALFGSQ